MKTCENCGGDSLTRYCDHCVAVMQYEARVHEDSFQAERFEADPVYMGGIDSDLMGEQ